MKYFKARAIFLLVMLTILLAGCEQHHGNKQSVQENLVSPVWDLTAISDSCLSIAELYQDIYSQAKENDLDFQSDGIVDEIEARLIENGYMVVDTQKSYPAYLANAEQLRIFIEKEANGIDAIQPIIRIYENGGFDYSLYQHAGGQRYYYTVCVKWDTQYVPYIAEQYELPVYDWKLTADGSFFYQLHRSDIHGADYNRLRLQPVDPEYYDMANHYILPVGYIQNNMFFTDWSEEDVSQLCFTDVFDQLYQLKNEEPFSKYDFPYSEEFFYYRIPAQLFEETVLEYFAITLQQLRKSAIGLDEEMYYPYAGMYLDYSHSPDLNPVVKDCADHADGTQTLTVWVESMEMGTDCLFSHELTIRPRENGGFQYVSNRITEAPEDGLPIPKNRLSYHQSTRGNFEIHVGGPQK